MKGKEGFIALTNFKWSLSIRTDKVASTCSVAILKPTLAIFLYYQQIKYYIYILFTKNLTFWWTRLWSYFRTENVSCDTISFDSMTPSQVTVNTAYP